MADAPPAASKRVVRADLLLLLAAMIWGFAFVAQRAGMAHIGPFLFNAIRFAIGAVVLSPFVGRIGARRRSAERGTALRKGSAAGGAAVGEGEAVAVGESEAAAGGEDPPAVYRPDLGGRPSRAWMPRTPWIGGLIAGMVLFIGVSFQQMGIVYTSAGKAGFITGLYVVIVPLMALVWGQRAAAGQWLGALLAAVGLYFLSIAGTLSLARGDLLVLIGAFFWAVHVHLIAHFTQGLVPVRLAQAQFWVCSALSLAAALVFEPIRFDGIVAAAVPILYAGGLSVGVAFTLQVIAQRDAHPAHAAILLSLEAVFAVAGGMLILGETLSLRAAFGCGLMLMGMVASQVSRGGMPKESRPTEPSTGASST